MASTNCGRCGACGFFNWGDGRQSAALTFAQKFHALAASRSEPNDRLVGERLIGISQQSLGEFQSARPSS